MSESDPESESESEPEDEDTLREPGEGREYLARHVGKWSELTSSASFPTSHLWMILLGFPLRVLSPWLRVTCWPSPS